MIIDLSINKTIRCLGKCFPNVLHLLNQLPNFKFLLRKNIPKIVLQLMIAQFIPFLKLAILLSLYLDSIIRKMYHHIQVVNIKLM